jgi:hypothetical protein
VAIVDGSELIQIDHRQRQRLLLAQRLLEDIGEQHVEMRAA